MVKDDLGASLKRLQHALDTRIALLGREHPDTLGAMDAIAALLRQHGKKDEAIAWESRAEGLRGQIAIKADPAGYKASFDELLRIGAALLDAMKTHNSATRTRCVADLGQLLVGSQLTRLVILHDEDIDPALVEARATVRQLLARMIKPG